MSSTESCTIYVIDDDPSIADSVGLLLALSGYRVHIFSTAEDFLAGEVIDCNACVLVDMRMPGMGGLELQHTLRCRGSSIPVILMSGHANVAASRIAFKEGAVDFLVKPIAETELREALSSAFGGALISATDGTVRKCFT